MSDNGEVEVENPVGNWPVLPKDVTAELGSIKLFNSGFTISATPLTLTDLLFATQNGLMKMSKSGTSH